MTTDEKLAAILAAIQVDPGNRGLAELFAYCPGDFAAACRSIAEHHSPSVEIITGYYIPTGEPPAYETDGPLGVVHLTRALCAIGGLVEITTDSGCDVPLQQGLQTCRLGRECEWDELPPGLSEDENRKRYWPKVWVKTIPGRFHPWDAFLKLDWESKLLGYNRTHVIAIERPGPAADDREYSMRGNFIGAAPAHYLFEHVRQRFPNIKTIGIGDGGNEIGMGKIPHEIIAKNIPYGDLIHCRVPTDHLIVAGVSNWGAYALAAGIYVLRGVKPPPDLYDPDREREILEIMVREGPLVDGVTGKQTTTVDGLTWEEYVQPLIRIREILES
jgi:D-glutamate cyclase